MEIIDLNHPNCMKRILMLLVLILHLSVFGQFQRKILLGDYVIIQTKLRTTFFDSSSISKKKDPILKIEPIVINYFPGGTLFLKRYKRFMILNETPITCLGLNTDNATVFGKYKVKGDTIIFLCKYSIQHFNQLAQKRRVKIKMDTIYKYKIQENRELQIDSNFVWRKLIE